MADDHDSKNFNAERIFVILFVFTALEVIWGLAGDKFGMPKFWLWSGLGICAYIKFVYILNYFMHFKFEGWIVKGLIVPTPLLILVIFLNTRPDVGQNDYRLQTNGTRFNPRTQEVETMGAEDAWIEDELDKQGGH
jgi:cytochrome c oxidase subunit IV